MLGSLTYAFPIVATLGFGYLLKRPLTDCSAIQAEVMSENYLLFVNVSYSFSILRPLQSAIQRRGATAAWYLQDLGASHLKPEERLLHSVDEVKRFNPRAVFAPGNWVPDFFPGVKVQVFHGFGIEKKGHFDIRGFFDLYCTSGPLTTRPFKRLERKYGYFRVVETGWPKTDHLLRYKPQKITKTTNGNGKPVVLYAPTFSPSLSSASALLSIIKTIAAKGNLHWLVKFHPLMDKRIVAHYRMMQTQNLQIIDDPDITPYLHAADVMVSDTSSVVAEFLMLKKPVLTYRTKTPAEHILNFQRAEDLEGLLEKALCHPENLRTAAKAFIDQMHPFDDGRSSERVLTATDLFVDQHKGRLGLKPFNLFRKLQVRRRMKYYHWK